ncbi:hypothetical protein [Paracnuella aquatica]|uniref:hypothetical protein n=1 Tax=Paracnuella aquatica TaxID=2268757 RepID=UPI000DEF9F88|nr:hypothetical protein [Paracnuella aquatica]RPD49183.1 hypothetical protein DRJ53_08700 [Paracnuella aquatica]
MTTQQFNTIHHCKELRRILIKGACIGSRQTSDMQVLLFQLPKVYVEVFLNTVGDEVLGKRNFKSLVGLQPYLQPASHS